MLRKKNNTIKLTLLEFVLYVNYYFIVTIRNKKKSCFKPICQICQYP